MKMDLALNNLQRLICHKTQQTNLFPVIFTGRHKALSFGGRCGIALTMFN